MKNLKINTNFKELPEEKILKHRNFESFLQNATKFKTPFYKSMNFILGAGGALVATSLVVIYFTFFHEKAQNIIVEKEITGVEINAEDLFITPPFDSLKPVFREYQIDMGEDHILEFETGTRIFIPAYAFNDRNGNTVTGKAIIKYKEFHTPLEFFLSGIPMNYDSSGNQYLFESSGMFDIRAFQDKEELALAAGKQIDFEFATFNPIKSTNFYYLNEEEEKWTFVDQIRLSENKTDTHGLTFFDQKEQPPLVIQNQITPEISHEALDTTSFDHYQDILIEPNMLSSEKYVFEIDYDKDEFPELAIYDNILFEVKDKNNFNPVLFDIYWENLYLTRASNNEYILNLQSSDSIVFLTVFPVVEQKDFQKARTIYEAEQDKKRKKTNEPANNFNAYRKTNQDISSTFSLSRQFASYAGLEQVGSFTLQINRMGTFNCDRPIVYPKAGKDYKVAFESPEKKMIPVVTIFYTDLNKNILYTSDSPVEARIDKNNTNVLWAITKTGNIVIVGADMLKEKLIKPGKDITFEVREYDVIEGMNKLAQIIKS